MAESVGSFPLPRGSAAGGAIHDGTTQPALDTSDGLVSAIAGQDLHAIEFSGAEIGITVSGTSINLEEENEADPEDGSTPWVSHPATIGYSREGTSHTAVAPQTASGMSAGTPGDQLEELEDFGGSSNQNPTSASRRRYRGRRR